MNNTDLDKKVKQLVHQNRYEKGYACAIDILQQLSYLSKKDYEDWCFGRVDCLEKVCQVNLSKLTRINKLIRKHALDLSLESSWTGYNKYGKGPKQRLRFSKSGRKAIEDTYATHYIDKKRIKELKEQKNNKASL